MVLNGFQLSFGLFESSVSSSDTGKALKKFDINFKSSCFLLSPNAQMFLKEISEIFRCVQK